jgi:hypothetical protein
MRAFIAGFLVHFYQKLAYLLTFGTNGDIMHGMESKTERLDLCRYQGANAWR